MQKNPLAKTMLVLLTIALTTAAHATDAPATQATNPADYSNIPSISVDRFTVAPDASYDEIYEQTRIIRDQDGVQNGSVISMRFTAGLQTVEAQEAYVIKVDGSKIPVSKEQITIKDAPGSDGYADFGDNKVIQVLFPNVAVGDKLYAKLHMHSKPLFAGRFSAFDYHVITGYPYQYTLSVDAPKSLKLSGKARGDIKLTHEDKGQREVFTVTESLKAYQPDESSPLSGSDYAGAVSISNFKDWADMARAYDQRAEDKRVVTPEIKALATQLVGNKTGLDAVKAVDTWVRSNIRYVQVYLDAGGYVPHTAASILKNRYGDCKDYSTLTQTLLKAAGIDSETVLVGTMSRYQQLPLAGPEQFDHAILYVPSLKMYLDPTNRFAPAGRYQSVLEGKPVLHTTTGKMQTFPVSAAQANLLEQRNTLTLTDDGTIQGEMTLSSTGTLTSTIRNAFSGVTPEQFPQIVERILQRRDEAGTGSMKVAPEFSDAGRPEAKSEDVSAHWISPKLVNMDDEIVAFKLPIGFTPFAFSNLNDDIAAEKRITPEVVGQNTMHKITTLTIPNSYKVLHLPKPVKGEDDKLAYNISYKQEGQNIIADQSIAYKKNVISPKDYTDFRANLQRALKATSATILLEKK